MVEPIRNKSPWDNKPVGGFWASSVDARNTWNVWCSDQGFETPLQGISTLFEIDRAAKVCRITTMADYLEVAKGFSVKGSRDADLNQQALIEMMLLGTAVHPNPGNFVALDYEALKRSGYQAMHVTDSALEDPELRWFLHGWDTETLLVMDSRIVHPLRLVFNNETIEGNVISKVVWDREFHEEIARLKRICRDEGAEMVRNMTEPDQDRIYRPLMIFIQKYFNRIKGA
jgi:hypothetical protein